jgi:hypothetical protein
MQSSAETKGGAVRGAMTSLGSSIFGLAGTVLLVCWLLAYVLEPEGGFARLGLVFAVSSYAIDLVWEKVSLASTNLRNNRREDVQAIPVIRLRS